jgi:hypothetical protein
MAPIPGFGLSRAAATAALLVLATTAAAAQEIPVVAGRIDRAAAEGSQGFAASCKFLEDFPDAPGIIYLDLTVAPGVTGEGDAQVLDFGVVLFGAAGAPLEGVPCALGQSQMIDRAYSAISFSAGSIYPHLVLTAEIRGGDTAPFNTLSCDYAPSEAGQVVLRMTGFFVVQQAQIPTARDVRLVPYLPPHDVAVQTLAKAGQP